jgi:hypothetical protein
MASVDGPHERRGLRGAPAEGFRSLRNFAEGSTRALHALEGRFSNVDGPEEHGDKKRAELQRAQWRVEDLVTLLEAHERLPAPHSVAWEVREAELTKRLAKAQAAAERVRATLSKRQSGDMRKGPAE